MVNLKGLAIFVPHPRELIAPVLLLVVFGLAIAMHPPSRDTLDYTLDLLRSMLKDGTARALLATGAGLVLASAGVDLSVVGVAVMSGVLFALGVRLFELAPADIMLLACLITTCVLIGSGVGAFNGWTVARFKAPALIVTWGIGAIVLIIAVGLAELMPRISSLSGLMNADASGIPIANELADLTSDSKLLALLASALFIGIPIFLSAFNIGRNARAVGAHRISAMYAGIRVRKTLLATYAASGAFAAGAGVWLALLEGKAMTASYAGLELSAIAIAVRGGTAMSGGYFSPVPIVCAAYFWSVMLSLLQGPDVPTGSLNTTLQAKAAEALFALALILVSIALGRRLSGDTVTINIHSRIGGKA